MNTKKLGWALAVLIIVSLACSVSGETDAGLISVEISSPVDGSSFAVGQEVFVVASAIAEQGVSKVYLSVNGQIIGTEEPADLPQAHVTNFSWVPVAEGNIVLSIVATDGDGQSSEPVTVNVTVVAAGDDQGSTDGSTDGSSDNTFPTDTPELSGLTDDPTNTPEATSTDAPPPTETYTPHPPTPTLTPTPTPTPTPTIGISIIPGIILLLPNVETVWEQVSVPANDIGYATATCPDGKLALGGGYAANSNMYVYTQSRQGNGWRAYGSNLSGSSILLNSYVVCIANVANGSVTQVHNQITAPANTYGHAVVSCPGGSTVVGGGWATNSTASLKVYNSTKKDNGWQVYANNSKNTGQLMNVYAICLSSDSNISSSQVFESVDVPANSTKGQDATCPSGDFATGGGFALSDNLLNYNTSPADSDIWRAYAKNTGGSAKKMNVYAICLSFD